MSQCKKCLDFYHPDYMVIMEIRGDFVPVCAWCKIEKDVLTITDENGKIVETVNKKQASINYKRWLDELRKRPNIAKIIDEQQK